MIHLIVVLRWHRGDLLGWLDAADRRAVYAVTAPLIAVITAFSIAALAVIATAQQGQRMAMLRRTSGSDARRTWLRTMRGPLVSSLLLLLAMILDRVDTDPGKVRFVAEFAVFFATLRMVRLFWLFGAMLEINDMDRERPISRPRPVKIVER